MLTMTGMLLYGHILHGHNYWLQFGYAFRCPKLLASGNRRKRPTVNRRQPVVEGPACGPLSKHSIPCHPILEPGARITQPSIEGKHTASTPVQRKQNLYLVDQVGDIIALGIALYCNRRPINVFVEVIERFYPRQISPSTYDTLMEWLEWYEITILLTVLLIQPHPLLGGILT